ncbi:hypothetical protein Tco_0845242 [Tanacetum coccineum]
MLKVVLDEFFSELVIYGLQICGDHGSGFLPRRLALSVAFNLEPVQLSQISPIPGTVSSGPTIHNGPAFHQERIGAEKTNAQKGEIMANFDLGKKLSEKARLGTCADEATCMSAVRPNSREVLNESVARNTRFSSITQAMSAGVVDSNMYHSRSLSALPRGGECLDMSWNLTDICFYDGLFVDLPKWLQWHHKLDSNDVFSYLQLRSVPKPVHFIFKLGIPTGTNPKRRCSIERSLPEPRSPAASVRKLVDTMLADQPPLRRVEALNSPKSPETSGTVYENVLQFWLTAAERVTSSDFPQDISDPKASRTLDKTFYDILALISHAEYLSFDLYFIKRGTGFRDLVPTHHILAASICLIGPGAHCDNMVQARGLPRYHQYEFSAYPRFFLLLSHERSDTELVYALSLNEMLDSLQDTRHSGCHKIEYRSTTPSACAISGLVQSIANIKLPTADAYGTRDISILSFSLARIILGYLN